MALFRSSQFLKHVIRSSKTACSRPFSVKSVAATKAIRPLVLGCAAVAGLGYGAYKLRHKELLSAVIKGLQPEPVYAASTPESQPSVFSPTKDHALYLWIHLKPSANVREVARVAAKLQKFVDEVVDPKMKDEDDEILAGVGFGPNFYNQVSCKSKENFTYPHRKGVHGDMPSSGGDVFIHAKSNEMSKLFELAQVFLKNLPSDSIEEYEDIYSFVYRNGRDLSGFIDGTENAADEDSRKEIAVEKDTGGSYVITQKWLHKLDYIDSEKDKTLEGIIGRTKSDSTELKRKSITSHVSRMTSGNNFNAETPFEIVRQSMPFGTLAGEHGLFFIGYAESPENFEYMLKRMVGAGGDGHSDDIMKLSENSKGTYWYFPSVDELKKMQ
ncbi:dye-decolorizing peroxidase YfeX-like [Gigantopelta aegis]|uniref:dye-decolorizing peroxidase YfeX-like n=1 Tax=Gigantopelta aegis TaxID=1735272 RepID=UPI001B88C078|nr:dye-decolorizing peroxidase YfeX-like [Gigantopelta aegis]